MTTSPVGVVNSPASGTHYYATNSGYWFVPNGGTNIDTFASTYAGANGSGGLRTVSSITAAEVEPLSGTVTGSFTFSGGNSAHSTSSNGTNGSTVFTAGGWWSGSGAPGSIEFYSTYTGHPTLPNNLSISTGQATEGSVISIFGNYLDGVNAIVFGGGVGASFSIVNAGDGNRNNGQINVTVPAGARNGAIELSSPNGQSFTANFNVIANITGWNTASATVGTNILLFGTGFLNTTAVGFPPSSTAASFTVNSDGQITATVPAASGRGNVTVYSNGGNTSFGTFATPPTVSGYSVSSGTVGTTLNINGTGFTQVTGVTFTNGVSATYSVISNAQINVTVPSGAVTGGITVFTQSGSATGPSFAVLPNISGLSTSSGHVGDTITINGSGFTGTTQVAFTSSVTASYTITNDGAISVTVPAGAVLGTISVTNAGGTATSTTFSVLPLITGVSPSTAPPGSVVTISGSGFTGTTAVTFFNNIAATSYTVVSDSSITATVPTGSTSGPITVTNASGSASSGSITVSSMHVFRSGAWTQAQNVYVFRSGAWVAAAGVFVFRSGSWVSAG